MSNKSLLFAESDACSHVLPPTNAQFNSTMSMEVTSRDFIECLADLNSIVCEIEQLCSISDQLSCRLHFCEVVADNNVRQNQTNFDVYMACFSAVLQPVSGPPDTSPNTSPNETSVRIVTVSFFQYCMGEIDDYETCISILVGICFSETLLTSKCLMALPSLCGLLGFLPKPQQACMINVEMMLAGSLPSMCGQSENMQTCVSS